MRFARRLLIRLQTGLLIFTSVVLAGVGYTACAGSTQAPLAGPVPLLSTPHRGTAWPVYHPSPRVDPGQDPRTANVTYSGGKVLDGQTNVYAIFWEDGSYVRRQSQSQQILNEIPNYIRVLTNFFHDFGTSPMYADLLQYTDSKGHAPTSARLAGTYLDTSRPFPPKMKADLALSSQPDLGGFYHQEIINVAKQFGWDYQNSHNFFFLFPIASNGCGAHGFLGDRSGENISHGSAVAYGSYPFADGQDQCVVSPNAPNGDHVADIATGIAAHELMEAAADPYINGWGEIADPCLLPPATIDPATGANVKWNGHPYLIQEMWDNYRHGCVLEGP